MQDFVDSLGPAAYKHLQGLFNAAIVGLQQKEVIFYKPYEAHFINTL